MFARSLVVAVVPLLLTFAVTGCSASSSTNDDAVADEADDLSKAPIAFANTSRAKNATIGGLACETYALTAAMKTKVETLDGSASYGGYYAWAAKFDPADLAPVIADDAKLSELVAAMTSDDATALTSTEGLTIDSLTRGQVFGHVVDHDGESTTLEDWDAATRATFKSALRVVVRSMLSSPSARAWHVEISQDWTDDAWVSIDPSTGEVKMIVHGGDM
jgi:hypothetical protein